MRDSLAPAAPAREHGEAAQAAEVAHRCMRELRALLGEHASVDARLAARLRALLSRHETAVEELFAQATGAAGRRGTDVALARAVIAAVCEANGVELEELRAHVRDTHAVATRVRAMLAARSAGASAAAIGAVLNRRGQTVAAQLRRVGAGGGRGKE